MKRISITEKDIRQVVNKVIVNGHEVVLTAKGTLEVDEVGDLLLCYKHYGEEFDSDYSSDADYALWENEDEWVDKLIQIEEECPNVFKQAIKSCKAFSDYAEDYDTFSFKAFMDEEGGRESLQTSERWELIEDFVELCKRVFGDEFNEYVADELIRNVDTSEMVREVEGALYDIGFSWNAEYSILEMVEDKNEEDEDYFFWFDVDEDGAVTCARWRRKDAYDATNECTFSTNGRGCGVWYEQLYPLYKYNQRAGTADFSVFGLSKSAAKRTIRWWMGD